MSLPTAVVQYIVNNLNGRNLLTFNVNNPTITTFKAVLPVCCFFYDPSDPQFPQTNFAPEYFQKNPQNAGLMYVYNPTTKRVETMDQTYCLTQMPLIDSDPMFWVNAHPIASKTTSLPAEQFTLTSTGIQLISPSSGKAAELVRYDNNWLDFCMTGGDPTYCTVNINLVNGMTYSDLNQIQSVQLPNLCCSGGSGNAMTDFSTVLLAFFSWTKPYNNAQAQSTLSPFLSLQACQAADAVCSCPFNTQCWMFNNSNVPCCIQGNPLDTAFTLSKPVLITQDKAQCEAQAVNCSQWRFNTVDVPCCVQRSPAQWLQANYSNTGLQSFNTKSDCDAAAAAAGTCTFQSLLTPSTQNKDYYKLILESQYTSGCDLLRTALPWGDSFDCTDDPNPPACYAANCNQNYCERPWMASTSNPYMFTQQVRCLPTATQCCPVGKTRVINNPQQSNVFSSCE